MAHSSVNRFTAVVISCYSLAAVIQAEPLPGAYFRLMEAGAAKVEQRLNAEPGADLLVLEKVPGWRHFPSVILVPAVLYAKKHPQNTHYHDPRMSALAIRIGDLLADANEKGIFAPRLDSDWDAYMWLEAYRLLANELGPTRAARWKKALLVTVPMFEQRLRDCIDFPWYSGPFVATSPNHFALYAVNLYLGGRVFGNREWEDLGAKVLHRFVTEEQTEDGYWGEHSRRGPATGYNHVTVSAVALYSEYSDDPAAIAALRRATDFHEHFTFADGTPADVINDRNRYWGVTPWGQFGFSRFPDGRRYAEFVSGFFKADDLEIEDLGRVAQDALYYHEGPLAPIPQDQEHWFYQMKIPGGMRKSGLWQVCLSGIIDTPPIDNQFVLDRQAEVSVFHRDLGLIITGANSKHQPELATFTERLLGQLVHMPVNSRLVMNEKGDRLSVAYHTFFSDLEIPEPTAREVSLHFLITGKYSPPDEALLTLQLCLKAGEVLETGTGKKITLGADRVDLDAADLGGSIRHHGWTLKTDSAARLVWPVYPFNPYANGPETSVHNAVATLSVPVVLKVSPRKAIQKHEQEISFTLSVP
jgi:hypothetical protein